MATSRTKVSTNGNKAVGEETDTAVVETDAPGENGTLESPAAVSDLAAPEPVVSSEPDDTEAPEAEAPEGSSVETELAATPVPIAAPTHLSQQEAIAQVNTANHDLVTLLEPLLTTTVTQKRLVALMVSQGGLSEVEGDAWLSHVKRLLEVKRLASQSLVRSLIDQ